MVDRQFCSNCGVPLIPGADFCSACGTAVTALSNQQKPAAVAPQQPQPPPPGQVAGAAATGATKPAMPSPLSGRTLAVIGGVTAVVVVIAGFAFFGGSSGTIPTPTPTPVPGPEPSIPDVEPGPDSQPEGRLRDLVQVQVGGFTLRDVAPYTDDLLAGAIDGLITVYEAGDGSEVIHVFILFPSEDAARAYATAQVEGMQQEGYELVESSPFRNGQTGHLYALTIDNLSTIWYLLIKGDRFLAFFGVPNNVHTFIGDLPY